VRDTPAREIFDNSPACLQTTTSFIIKNPCLLICTLETWHLQDLAALTVFTSEPITPDTYGRRCSLVPSVKTASIVIEEKQYLLVCPFQNRNFQTKKRHAFCRLSRSLMMPTICRGGASPPPLSSASKYFQIQQCPWVRAFNCLYFSH
jgi:hypothetical protein